MRETIKVQGTDLHVKVFRAAIKAVFDAVPKAKRGLVFRQMSLVEAVGEEAFRRDDPAVEPTKDSTHPDGF